TQEGPVGRWGSPAPDHQVRRSVPEATPRRQREPHPWPVRKGQRPSTLGPGTRQAGREERQEASEGGGREKARGAAPPPMGDRRSVQDARLSRGTRRSPTASKTAPRQRPRESRRRGLTEETTNRPVRATA